MTRFDTLPRCASALMSLVCVLAFAVEPAVAGDDEKRMGYLAEPLDGASLEHENRASIIAIEVQIQAEIIWRLRQRAEAGESEALFVLGHVYETGRGTPQDFVLAHKWYNLAAAHGNQVGAVLRDEIASKMTPNLVLEAQRMARDWLAMQQEDKANATVSQMNF